ncbi:hypothetical protein LTR94_035249, partial [Friedmanniomyces endolithicus]
PCGDPTALRLPHRGGRGAEVLGRDQGPVARPVGQTPGGRGRGPSPRIRRLRRDHSRRRLRGRHGADVGHGNLDPPGRGCRGRLQKGRPEIDAGRRAPEGRLGA